MAGKEAGAPKRVLTIEVPPGEREIVRGFFRICDRVETIDRESQSVFAEGGGARIWGVELYVEKRLPPVISGSEVTGREGISDGLLCFVHAGYLRLKRGDRIHSDLMG